MSKFDTAVICDVLKPSCIIAQSVAITIGTELTLAPQEDPLVLGARAQALYVRIAPSMIPWFVQKECANMMVRWSEFLLQKRLMDDIVDGDAENSEINNGDDALPSALPATGAAVEETRHSTRIRRNTLRFKPSQNR